MKVIKNRYVRILFVALFAVAGSARAADSFAAKSFQYEEYAWLKAHGRADKSARSIWGVRQRNDPTIWPFGKYFGGEYNKRYTKDTFLGPVAQDRIPLPELSSAPQLDGKLDDACWQSASRGTARVSFPDENRQLPLAEYSVWAGRHQGWLYLAIKTDRPNNRMVMVSASTNKNKRILTFDDQGKLSMILSDPEKGTNVCQESRIWDVKGHYNAENGIYEAAIPLDAIGGLENGLTVNVGMGGKHIEKTGRAVNFVSSRLVLAQEGSCVSGKFKLRVGVANDGGPPLKIKGNVPGLKDGLTLTAGQSHMIEVSAKTGVLGPESDVVVGEGGHADGYELHLFQYEPLGHVLSMLDAMIDRMSRQGINVDKEKKHVVELRDRHKKLSSLEVRDVQAERTAFREARQAKRELFFRSPELQAIRKILFVKRQAFRPSHNYSAYLDGRFIGGGAVCLLDIPMDGDRLVPESAKNTDLFASGSEGILDTPMADFDIKKIYFAYRKSKADYYHLMSMNPDGSGVKQLTDGYFHDNWPCPLPDGGLAFISTRIALRFLCWRPQSFVLYRMEADGSGIRPLSFANISEWAPSVMNDGRIIWTRSEYQDKGANFGHTLWAIHPDGTAPELVFGNGIIQPSGFGNGRTVPGSSEISCTMMSHFGDINGPIALCDIAKGRFNPESITNITPDVLSVGNSPPEEECFRESVPLSKDLFLVSHAPRQRFGIYVIDRFGNREHVYSDDAIESLCPTPFHAVPRPPVLASAPLDFSKSNGVFFAQDVYLGLEPAIKRGMVKYLRVVEEVSAKLEKLPDGKCREDHPDYQNWYATPVNRVSGPFGWPAYVAKASHGLVPVAEDGSAMFYAPARKVLYFQALDKDLNELQRMRSVIQLQPGEKRSCIGCHESRDKPPVVTTQRMAKFPVELQKMSWEGRPLSFERDVQPVFDKKCISCHNAKHEKAIDLTGVLDTQKVPASYRALVSKGLVHYADTKYEPSGFAIMPPLSMGTTKSKLVELLTGGHKKVTLTDDEWRRIKTWIDCNCPLWPDYINWNERPSVAQKW